MSFAAPSIEDWKSYVLRSVHQDAAKSEIIDNLKPSQVLLIMDWAMKFIPTSFCETQRDWFGKKGKSWHLSVAITKAEDGTIEVGIMCLLFCLYRSLTTINYERALCCSNRLQMWIIDKNAREDAKA